ncbi:MAG: Kazal-type serine protease inhibitor family protein [Candidatus Woesearchaeota archaeon]
MKPIYVCVVMMCALLGACSIQSDRVDEDVRVCPAIYAPVCGVDNVTYGNSCEAGDVAIAYDGECGRTFVTDMYGYIVPDDCKSWFDGCNTCMIDEDGMMACTRIFCETPGEPYCMSDIVCSEEYAPVCGNDGVTYSNSCFAQRVGVAHEGACVYVCSEEQKQATMCTMEFFPVCGNDNVTYGNACAACSSGVDTYTDGEC